MEHNRIRLRGADWNDALDMAVQRGESVAFTYAYAGNLARLQELLKKLAAQGTAKVELTKELGMLLSDDQALYADVAKKQALLGEYESMVRHECSGEKEEYSTEELCRILGGMEDWWKETLRREEWLCGEYGFFNGYYDNHGRRVEEAGKDCREAGNTEKQMGQEGAKETAVKARDQAFVPKVRMMLTSQVFAVESGVATKEQTRQIIHSADKLLFRENAGGYCLNTDFGEVKDDLGRMFGFAYGHKENGAVFSHMAVMYGNALYRRGFADAGYKALHSLYLQAADFEKSKIYPGIPEYFNDRGRGMYHYLTGAASWYLMTVLTEMFGIRGNFGDLVFAPNLCENQFDSEGRAGAELVFAGRKLRVTYLKKKELEAGKICIYVHKKAVQGNRIPKEELESLDAKDWHEILVEIP